MLRCVLGQHILNESRIIKFKLSLQKLYATERMVNISILSLRLIIIILISATEERIPVLFLFINLKKMVCFCTLLYSKIDNSSNDLTRFIAIVLATASIVLRGRCNTQISHRNHFINFSRISIVLGSLQLYL